MLISFCVPVLLSVNHCYGDAIKGFAGQEGLDLLALRAGGVVDNDAALSRAGGGIDNELYVGRVNGSNLRHRIAMGGNNSFHLRQRRQVGAGNIMAIIVVEKTIRHDATDG